MPYRLSDPSVTVDGVRLECRRVGPAPDEAPTIVMLHEGLGSVAQWKEFPAQVAEATGCGVFVYSRQGYGGSDPVKLPRPSSYMHDEALKEHVKARSGAWTYPRWIEVRDELPKTATGKIQRFRLRAEG